MTLRTNTAAKEDWIDWAASIRPTSGIRAFLTLLAGFAFLHVVGKSESCSDPRKPRFVALRNVRTLCLQVRSHLPPIPENFDFRVHRHPPHSRSWARAATRARIRPVNQNTVSADNDQFLDENAEPEVDRVQHEMATIQR